MHIYLLWLYFLNKYILCLLFLILLYNLFYLCQFMKRKTTVKAIVIERGRRLVDLFAFTGCSPQKVYTLLIIINSNEFNLKRKNQQLSYQECMCINLGRGNINNLWLEERCGWVFSEVSFWVKGSNISYL